MIGPCRSCDLLCKLQHKSGTEYVCFSQIMRKQCSNTAQKALITRVLFILTRCSRLVVTGMYLISVTSGFNLPSNSPWRKLLPLAISRCCLDNACIMGRAEDVDASCRREQPKSPESECKYVWHTASRSDVGSLASSFWPGFFFQSQAQRHPQAA